jgi:hypothetical protein
VSAAIAYLLTTRTKSMTKTRLLTVIGVAGAASGLLAELGIAPNIFRLINEASLGFVGLLAIGSDQKKN